ncbi:MAG: Methionine--tRNA ligase [Chlamydiia bacterium]|nr:Methionine--tRNA ligase [Chlamydiia bacterium]
MEKQTKLITAALLYANGTAHPGHFAGCYLPADIYARAMRCMGHDVLYICGSDEFGLAIELSAEQERRTPRDHVDHYYKLNKELFEKYRIGFDHFSRTTWPGHAKVTVEFFEDLLRNGYIEKKESNQLYSEAENRFLADRYVEGTCPSCGFEKARGDECPSCAKTFEATDLINPISKVTRSKLSTRQTTHWYLKLDAFKEQLSKFMHARGWKSSVVNYLQSYVDDLHPRAITRDTQWGIPVPLPEADGKVFYVWFDAPIGYISASMDWSEKIGDPDAYKRFWLNDQAELTHFIGKDNIMFHGLLFPCMIMGQDRPYKLVDHIPANEFLTYEGRQFSKSEGWTIDLFDFLNRYPADYMRFVLASIAPENQDSEFRWKDFQTRINSELIGKFGNLCNRVLTFIYNKRGGIVPQCGELNEDDKQLISDAKRILSQMKESYSSYRVREAVAGFMELCSIGNIYFDHNQPWKLIKDDDQSERLDTMLYCSLSLLKTIAQMAFPLLPDTMERLWKQLGQKSSLKECRWDESQFAPLEFGMPLPKPETLFARVEDEQVALEEKQLQERLSQVNQVVEQVPEIAFDDFTKVDMRIGVILEAEELPKSKKLLKFQVKVGDRTHQIVSGIKHCYPNPQELIGKKVIVVANLKPAKLMGTLSEGMILASGEGDNIRLIHPEGESGEEVR